MNVPKLRFREFSSIRGSAWVKSSLKEFIEDHKGGAPLRPSDFLASGDYEVIPKKAISSGGKLNLDKLSPTYCTESFFLNNQRSVIDRSYLVTTLRDLVPSGPSIGYIVKIDDDNKYLLAQGVYGIKIKEELDEGFLIQFSNTFKYRELMQTMMVGSTQVHIRNGDFFKLPLDVPLLDEQKKISSFLSTVDQKITLLTKKHELLVQYKKGVMQKIFNQEIRFKDNDGRDFPEWEEKSIGDVAKLRNGYAFKSSSYDLNGEFTVVTIANVQSGRMIFEREIFLRAPPVDLQKHQILELGDILISLTGNVGRVCKVTRKNCLLNQRVGKLIPQHIYSDYLYHLVNHEDFVAAMIDLSQGGAQKNIGTSDVEGYAIRVPSESEQIKISTFLNSLQRSLDLSLNAIELTQKFKQGLLQQMFI